MAGEKNSSLAFLPLHSAEYGEYKKGAAPRRTDGRTDERAGLLCSMLLGHRLNGFLGMSLNDGTIIFLVILLDMTVSVG